MSILKKSIIFFGDIVLLYASLAIALLIRYGSTNFNKSLDQHLGPFTLVFIVWLLIFYLSDLYREKFIGANLTTFQRFGFSILLGTVVSIIILYLFTPIFQLTPKTNLVIFAIAFGILDFCWRILISKIYISSGWRRKLLFIGDSPIVFETVNHLKAHPQIGFDAVFTKSEIPQIEKLKKIINDSKIDTVIIQPSFKKDPEIIKIIYQLIALKVTVIDLISFYEIIFKKMPVEELEESWLIEKINSHRPAYEATKKIFDFLLSSILLIIFSPFLLIIAVLIKLTSKGPVIYRQKRIGFNNKEFTLYKFRTMISNHSGPLWTTQNDARLTAIGKFLRNAHLDEIPQLFNILKGDISFIGPRAERKELAELYSQLPYYDLRHIIKPGLTGWAQVNYKPSASVEEAKEKLKYDIYYIKNCSLILDFLILLKTIKYLFISLK